MDPLWPVNSGDLWNGSKVEMGFAVVRLFRLLTVEVLFGIDGSETVVRM